MDEGSGLLSEKPIVKLWLSETGLRGTKGWQLSFRYAVENREV